MTDVQALLKRETTADRIVGELVEGARGSVVEALGAVVASVRAAAAAGEVKTAIRDLDKRAKAYGAEGETLRPEVVKLDDQVVRARADREIAQRQKQRALAGLGGDLPDVGAVEDQLRDLEREREEKRVRLRTVTSKGREAERDKAVLCDLLRGLESVPAGDPDVLSVLGRTLAADG